MFLWFHIYVPNKETPSYLINFLRLSLESHQSSKYFTLTSFVRKISQNKTKLTVKLKFTTEFYFLNLLWKLAGICVGVLLRKLLTCQKPFQSTLKIYFQHSDLRNAPYLISFNSFEYGEEMCKTHTFSQQVFSREYVSKIWNFRNEKSIFALTYEQFSACVISPLRLL